MKIKYYLMVILLLLVSIPTTSNVSADDIATIHGVVKLDGNRMENVEIKIENLELNYLVVVFTDENGEYEGQLGVRNHNAIKVTATVNTTIHRSVTFTRSSDIHEYEVNFIFGESNNGNGNGIIRDSVVYIAVSTFFGNLWAWLLSLTLFDWLCLLLILLVLCLLFKLLFPKKPKRKPRTQQQDNDTIILLTGNGKVKKIR